MPTSCDVRLQPPSPTGYLLDDLRTLIDTARSQAVQAVNTTLVRLYWSIGLDPFELEVARAFFVSRFEALARNPPILILSSPIHLPGGPIRLGHFGSRQRVQSLPEWASAHTWLSTT